MPPVSRLRDLSSRVNASNTSPMRSGGMPGPLSRDVDRDARARSRSANTSAPPPYLTAFSIRLRTARRISEGRSRIGSRAASCEFTGLAEIAEILDHRIDQRREIDLGQRLARAAEPRERQDVVERAGSSRRSCRPSCVRSSSSSTDSIRTRSAASGVRRSWPIAPSIRSFSSSIAVTRSAQRVERGDQRARRRAGPLSATGSSASPGLKRCAAAASVAQRARDPPRRPTAPAAARSRRGSASARSAAKIDQSAIVGHGDALAPASRAPGCSTAISISVAGHAQPLRAVARQLCEARIVGRDRADRRRSRADRDARPRSACARMPSSTSRRRLQPGRHRIARQRAARTRSHGVSSGAARQARFDHRIARSRILHRVGDPRATPGRSTCSSRNCWRSRSMQPEVDRLRDEQRQRDQQRHLPGAGCAASTPQSRVTSAASV